MDRTDFIVTGIVAALMSFCFYLNSHWSFFFAGICATFLITVNVGRFAHLLENRNKEKAWDNFLNNLEKGPAQHPNYSKELATSSLMN